MHVTGLNFNAAEGVVVECHTNNMPFFKQFSILPANPHRHLKAHTTEMPITPTKWKDYNTVLHILFFLLNYTIELSSEIKTTDIISLSLVFYAIPMKLSESQSCNEIIKM